MELKNEVYPPFPFDHKKKKQTIRSEKWHISKQVLFCLLTHSLIFVVFSISKNVVGNS